MLKTILKSTNIFHSFADIDHRINGVSNHSEARQSAESRDYWPSNVIVTSTESTLIVGNEKFSVTKIHYRLIEEIIIIFNLLNYK